MAIQKKKIILLFKLLKYNFGPCFGILCHILVPYLQQLFFYTDSGYLSTILYISHHIIIKQRNSKIIYFSKNKSLYQNYNTSRPYSYLIGLINNLLKA